MSERVEMIKTAAESAFGRFDNAMKDLKDKEIEWRPVEEANNIKWILTHLSQEWNVGFPRLLKGDTNYKPAGWPDDYVGNKSYSLTKIVDDLKKGRETVLAGLGKLKAEELDVDIPSWGGTMRKRGMMLSLYISEIFHHEGQIAYIRGAINRRRQTDTHFLS